MEEKEEYEVVPCQNPQSLQKLQLGAQEKVHGLRWDTELVCGGDHIWEGCNSQGKNLICSYYQGIGLGKANGVGPEVGKELIVWNLLVLKEIIN